MLVIAWFVAQAANIGGNAAHLVLLAAIALLVYELLAEDGPATVSLSTRSSVWPAQWSGCGASKGTTPRWTLIQTWKDGAELTFTFTTLVEVPGLLS